MEAKQARESMLWCSVTAEGLNWAVGTRRRGPALLLKSKVVGLRDSRSHCVMLISTAGREVMGEGRTDECGLEQVEFEASCEVGVYLETGLLEML